MGTTIFGGARDCDRGAREPSRRKSPNLYKTHPECTEAVPVEIAGMHTVTMFTCPKGTHLHLAQVPGNTHATTQPGCTIPCFRHAAGKHACFLMQQMQRITHPCTCRSRDCAMQHVHTTYVFPTHNLGEGSSKQTRSDLRAASIGSQDPQAVVRTSTCNNAPHTRRHHPHQAADPLSRIGGSPGQSRGLVHVRVAQCEVAVYQPPPPPP